MTTHTPIYQHDCKQCEYLGTFHGMDHYRCTQPMGDSLIVRHSDTCSDYSSLCDFDNRMQATIRQETGGLTATQVAVLAAWRMMPSLVLNGYRR